MRALPLRTTLPAALAALLAACLLATAGCGSTEGSPTSAATADSPAARSSTPAAPDTSATTGSTPASTPASTGPATLTDRLLPTGDVPGLNATWRWQDGETGPASADPFGLCAKADLLSIGATDVAARSYFPPDDSDDLAAEQVAEFPDLRTAQLAWRVLQSWHDRCASQRDQHPALTVLPIRPVTVNGGQGGWYLASWLPEGEEDARFDAFGMVLSGTRIAVLRMANSGQDHDYPPGQEPMIGMVKAAADRLG